MLSTREAGQTILRLTSQLPAERVSLDLAFDRVLREAAVAGQDSPPFDASAMDGYALRQADVSAPLRIIGNSSAGAAFAGTVGPGDCVRIFTGAPVPAGADRVVKQEDTTREGDIVRVLQAEGPAFIRRCGENRRAGEVILAEGVRLGPPELAALASSGICRPLVSRRPRCVHLVTGNELIPPERIPVGAQIRDSNSTLITALLARHAVDLVGHARVTDDPGLAQAAVAAMPAHDLLLISGGASVGDHDHARPVLTALGYTLHFEQINLRPGRPLVFATRGTQLAFALPGNPVSHWVTFNLLVAPALRKFADGREPERERLVGRLATGSWRPPADARQTIWPAQATIAGGEHRIALLPLASSGDSSGLAGANALVPLPANGLDPAGYVEFIPCA